MGNIATVALMRHGGSHLIRPIVANLGFDIIEPGNFGAPLDQAVGPVIVFLRDPRDRIGATLRWWRGKPRKAAVLSNGGETNDEQLLYLLQQQGFLDEMIRWAKIWCHWEGSYVARFETMRYQVVGSIARHLGLPRDVGRDRRIFDLAYLKGRTYTGEHTKWREYFGPLSMEYWDKNGGPDLLNMMGYKP